MIPVRSQEQSLKQREAEKVKQKITSTLLEDATFNELINKKRKELSDQDFLQWLDEIRRYDKKKSELIEQQMIQKSQIKKVQQESIPQIGQKPKKYNEIEKQLELKDLKQQINTKVRKAQNDIDRQRLFEFDPKQKNVQTLFHNNEDLLKREQNKRDLQQFLSLKKQQQIDNYKNSNKNTQNIGNENSSKVKSIIKESITKNELKTNNSKIEKKNRKE